MKAEIPDDHITDYERAVCYYTLPRLANPVTYGLVIAYAVCVLEALAVLVYGLYAENSAWTVAGAWAFLGIVVFGMIIFMTRALINDWNRRAALAAARNVPDATEDEDIPDPFAEHILLRRPLHTASEIFACVTNESTVAYYVEIRRNNTHWRVRTPQEQPAFEILVELDLLRVGLLKSHPVRLGVYEDKKKIASVVRRNTLRSVAVDVFPTSPADVSYSIKNGCIYLAGRLIGRIYALRECLYLDIEREHAVPGILTHFISME